MPRTLIVWYPDWPAVAAGCRPEEPAVVVFANRVVAATAAARADGVTLGLRRREAQARCPEVEVVAADGGRDARSWEPVVAAIETLTPGVEILAPGEIALATRGPSRYFGGDPALAELVARTVDSAVGVAGSGVAGSGVAGSGVAGSGVAGSGVAGCRVGVADGRFVAGLAARVAGKLTGERVVVVERGRSRQWLAPQPVSALGEGYEELAGLLVRLGVRTLGDFARLPAPAVLGRFGTSGETAHKIARGLDPRPVTARTPPPEMAVSAEFDPPETRIEAAAFVAKGLADQLLERLEQQGLAATMVSIEAQTEHAEHLVRHWRHEGALSAGALAERTRWQLEGWFAGTGGAQGCTQGCNGTPSAGLTLLRLVPEEVHPDTGRQLGFWGGSAESDARATRAFARVQGLLGPDAVMTAVRAGGRGWAEQIRLVPWGDSRESRESREETGPSVEGGRRRRRARGGSAESPPWPGRLGTPAPAVVYVDPKRADATGADAVRADAMRADAVRADAVRAVRADAVRADAMRADADAMRAEMLDAAGRPVEINGRGLLSSPPLSVSIAGGSPKPVTAWAGPWPIEERWWDRGGGRRRARIQVLLDGGDAHLLSREGGRWWVEASYS